MKNIFFILAFCSSALLVSCGSSTRSSDKDVQIGSLNYVLDIDNYGRDLVFVNKPKKVLTLGPNCTELFVALGLEDYVVGRSLVNHSRGSLPEFEEKVNSIPIVNNAEVTREGVLTSGADFVYAIEWEISDVGCNIDEAKSYGIDVYVNNATSFEEQYKEIEDLGKIFQIEDRAQEFINSQKSRIEEVTKKLDGIEPLDVLVYDSNSYGVFTATGSNFETDLIEASGGVNIFDDINDKQWTTVGYEDILQRNPDIIIIHDYDVLTFEEKVEEIKANPILAKLDCVKNENFVKIDLESVLPGNRMANTVEYFYEEFHKVK